MLILSLAFNLLVVGVAAGGFFMRHHGWGGKPWGRDKGIERIAGYMLRHVPEARRKPLIDKIKADRMALTPGADAFRKARANLETAMRAEPFKADNVRAAVQALSDIHRQRRVQMTESLIDILKQLTPKEREVLLQRRWFKRLFSARPHHRHGPRRHRE